MVKRSKTSENSRGTFVINRFRQMHGAFGWLGDKFNMSLVMDSDICFPTRCCNCLEHKLHSAALYSFFAEYSKKNFRFLLEAIFEFWTPSPTIKTAFFKPDVILAYRQNNVSYIAWQTYTGTYRYIDSPLGML